MYNMNINLGFNFRLEILILICVILLIGSVHLFLSCCRCNMFSVSEGFTPANTNFGQSSEYILGQKPISMQNWGTANMIVTPGTATWGMPNLTMIKGQTLDSGVKNILNRPEQPIPLPEGELSMFATTQFKPECCPNAYSNSSGCACMTMKQYNYLIERGGNNVPYSEY